MNYTFKYYFIFLLFLLDSFANHSIAQERILNVDQNKIDSLLRILQKQTADTKNHTDKLADSLNINTLSQIAQFYLEKGDFPKAINYANHAHKVLDNISLNYPLTKYRSLQSSLYLVSNIIGTAHISQGNVTLAREYFLKALTIIEKLGLKKTSAGMSVNIGNTYLVQGNYIKALDFYFKALKILEQFNDKTNAATTLSNIGVVYHYQGNQEKALEFYFKALKIREKGNDKRGLADSYSCIGGIYQDQGKYTDALKKQFLALKLYEQLNAKDGIALTYHNISITYASQKLFQEALDFELKSLNIKRFTDSKIGIIESYINIGDIYFEQIKQKNNSQSEKQAISYMNLALSEAKQINDRNNLKAVYYKLFMLNDFLSNHKKALDYHKLYILYHDSLINEENTKKTIQAEMNYEFDKIEAIYKVDQQKQKLIAAEENTRQKNIRNMFVAGFIIMLLLAIFVFRNYRLKQQSNAIISLQKTEVEKQRDIIEQKQTQIIDSINYAKRIQSSILPDQDILKNELPNSFILFKPKDIVSGDFYWFTKKEDYFFIVVADCTGHGVPGAFLSMIGATLLNEIVNHNSILLPSKIITELGKNMSLTLANTEKENQNTDGMDISIVRIEKQTNKILFAGANHSLYLTDNTSIKRIESQVNSINGVIGIPKDQTITDFEINSSKNLTVFMTTDGYTDQIGGDQKKKFLVSRLEKILLESHALTSQEQKEKLENCFISWKDNMRQIDDVLVIGFKF